MNLELKSIKYTEWMSEETLCFTANLWVDGKVFAGLATMVMVDVTVFTCMTSLSLGRLASGLLFTVC